MLCRWGQDFSTNTCPSVKEVRKSSFALPDKTATACSAEIFQTTNHFRNLASTLTSSGNQPLVFLRNTHLSCNRMSQTASRSFIPGIWPTQKRRKEAQRTDIFLIKGKTEWANTLDKVYPEHWTKGPKIAMGSSSTVFHNELYRLVKEMSGPQFSVTNISFPHLSCASGLFQSQPLSQLWVNFWYPKKGHSYLFVLSLSANRLSNPRTKAVKTGMVTS